MTKFKVAFKTALAMTIAFAMALSMDWDKPHWAGLAVAMSSLTTVGDSLNKGLLRVFGTLAAVVVALTLLTLFPQERWPFLFAMSAYMAFCTYMMGRTSRWYFWHVAGFTIPILTLTQDVSGLNSFDLTIMRTQETMLGIVVYSLVSVLLWPQSSRKTFEQAVQCLVGQERTYLQECLRVLKGMGDEGYLAKLRAQAAQSLAQLGPLLDGAELDSYEIWELRRLWRNCYGQLAALGHALEAWRLGFADLELETLDPESVLPGFQGFVDELDARIASIEEMLGGQPPEHKPGAVSLKVDEKTFRRHFHRAAFTLARNQMAALERITRTLFETVSDLRGFERRQVSHTALCRSAFPSVPDLDHLASVVRLVVSLWLALLAVIYVPDVPSGASLVCLCASISMAMINTPFVPVNLLFRPIAVGLVFAGTIHIFVMPHFSGFAALSIIIFVATFLICYWNAAPQQRIGRSAGLALFVILASISNAQSYSFLKVVNIAMVFPLMFAVFAITAHFPLSFRPEDVWLRMLTRFFRSAAFLVGTLGWQPLSGWGWWFRRKIAFHMQEVTKIPQKLAVWQRVLPKAVLRSPPQGQLQRLLSGLQDLSFRIQALFEVRQHPPAGALVETLVKDIWDWRAGIQEVFDRLAENPGSQAAEGLRARLTALLEHIEAQIEKELEQPHTVKMSLEDKERIYRLLGAYRGVSETLVECAASASAIDWVALREERFSW
jgi:uncharacterized membrane protein YccC